MTSPRLDEIDDVSIPDRVLAPRFVGGGQIGTWEREVPQPGRGQLLIQVRANAICGTDREQYMLGSTAVPGHEAAGIVVRAGEGASIAVGTPGVVFLMDFCGSCRSCLAGATNQCLAKRADMGFTHDGGYGRYELVHESNFFSIPTALPLAEATLLLDVMGTTGHAFARARLVADDVRAVAVSGAGPIGLGLVVMGRLVLGADVPVVVADVQSTRLELIGELGGHPVDLRATTLSGGLRALGLTEVDVAIDTAGKSASRRMLLDVLAKRGALVCVGHGEGLELTISPDLIAPERTILGSEYFRFDELPGNLDLLREHMDELAPIITHRFPVDELSRAFELFMSGATGKVVVEQ
jgi:threonine dehydrogenase-like Zn-dependent dehydrogenase